MTEKTTITITQPDDWHVHLRDDVALQTTVPHTAAQFGRALVMPNLKPPITTAAQALSYRARIIEALPKDSTFEPLMSLYLTDNIAPSEIMVAKRAGIVTAKLYPAGATTNSDMGVTNLHNIYPVLDAMQKNGMLLLVHGEVTDPKVDIFDREAVFIETQFKALRRDFPELKIVFEHITTQNAAQYIAESDSFTAATITAHHLLYNRNALFQQGIRPHYYCLPVLKREKHRLALLQAATSGSSKFFLGTDSAPHASILKEHSNGCAGCYTADAAMELYVLAFEQAGALDKLEGFASHFGADFYGLPRHTRTITLIKETWQSPEFYPLGNAQVKPLHSGLSHTWKLQI